MAAPVFNTVLSTIFRITSRLAKNKPLKKDYSLLEKTQKPVKIPSINEFINSIQNKKPVKYEEIKTASLPKQEDDKNIFYH